MGAHTMSTLHYYSVPSPQHAGRWLVVYRLPGMERWDAPVADCASQAAADAEADRLNGATRPTRVAA
jgi:hypothetical protein